MGKKVSKGFVIACCIEAVLVVTFIVSVVLLFQPYNVITVYYSVSDVKGENIASWQLINNKLIMIMKDGNVRVETIPLTCTIYDPLLSEIAIVTLVIALFMIIPIGVLKDYN